MTTKPEISRWRGEAERLWLRCTSEADPGRSGDLMVRFAVGEEEYLAFVPERFVGEMGSRLEAVIIADVNGGVLVDIPVETFTSGRRILVRDTERESILILQDGKGA